MANPGGTVRILGTNRPQSSWQARGPGYSLQSSPSGNNVPSNSNPNGLVSSTSGARNSILLRAFSQPPQSSSSSLSSSSQSEQRSSSSRSTSPATSPLHDLVMNIGAALQGEVPFASSSSSSGNTNSNSSSSSSSVASNSQSVHIDIASSLESNVDEEVAPLMSSSSTPSASSSTSSSGHSNNQASSGSNPQQQPSSASSSSANRVSNRPARNPIAPVAAAAGQAEPQGPQPQPAAAGAAAGENNNNNNDANNPWARFLAELSQNQGGNVPLQIDAQQTVRQTARLIPFLTLLLLSSLFEHALGLITVLACSAALVRVQIKIDTEVKRLDNRDKTSLCFGLLIATVHVAFLLLLSTLHGFSDIFILGAPPNLVNPSSSPASVLPGAAVANQGLSYVYSPPPQAGADVQNIPSMSAWLVTNNQSSSLSLLSKQPNELFVASSSLSSSSSPSPSSTAHKLKAVLSPSTVASSALKPDATLPSLVSNATVPTASAAVAGSPQNTSSSTTSGYLPPSYPNLALLPFYHAHMPFWSCVWVVLITSLTVRYSGQVFECLLLLIYPRRLKQYMLLTRAVHSLYRQFLPITVWCAYFASGTATHVLFQSSLVGLYLVYKLGQLNPVAQQVGQVMKTVITGQPLFGRYPSSADLAAAGGQCSICFNDFDVPVQLPCNAQHIFCESCITQWLDQEKTCPLCRAQVEYAQMQLQSVQHTYLPIQIF